MKTGTAVVFQQDWTVNIELEKLIACREKALAIIYHLRMESLAGDGF
jgi:hypothetical protein